MEEDRGWKLQMQITICNDRYYQHLENRAFQFAKFFKIKLRVNMFIIVLALLL